MNLNLEYLCKSIDELNKFEEDLMLIIKNLHFRNIHNKFQVKLKHDIIEIRNSNKVIVAADKINKCYFKREYTIVQRWQAKNV